MYIHGQVFLKWIVCRQLNKVAVNELILWEKITSELLSPGTSPAALPFPTQLDNGCCGQTSSTISLAVHLWGLCPSMPSWQCTDIPFLFFCILIFQLRLLGAASCRTKCFLWSCVTEWWNLSLDFCFWTQDIVLRHSGLILTSKLMWFISTQR